MSGVKHIPIAEFKEVGFLQEANRQFFHPHGLALEVTVVSERDGERAYSSVSLLDSEMEMLRALIAAQRKRGVDLTRIERRLDEAKRHELGDVWISGVWDYREDSEGIIYGEWEPESEAKAEAVEAQREKHYRARKQLFGCTDGRELCLGADVEPVGWIAPPGTFDDEPAEAAS